MGKRKPSKAQVNPTTSAAEKERSHVTIKVHRQQAPDVFLRIKRDIPLRRLKIFYCDQHGLEYDTIRFTYDGVKIGNSQTANELGMVDGDVIDTWSEQDGGCG
ncbi:hypothetical protein L1049_019720 [Liquidambar formosana]|uniref:Ubiquitin-like domain-containing protein n=1 Tax=Liquidambar formosana TaxID=63359 RepID=A0AAP0SC17_LIQFO